MLYETHKTYALDELLIYSDIWITVHVWAEGQPNAHGITWINFRLIEHESHTFPEDNNEIRYPSQSLSRPSPDSGTTDARRCGDEIGSGFIKWDGCQELEIDHHCCGVRNFIQIATAMLRLNNYVAGTFGFENCSNAGILA